MMRNHRDHSPGGGLLWHFINQNIRIILLVVACFLFLMWPRGTSKNNNNDNNNNAGVTSAHCPVFGKRYGIMMDAGSTGSRTHVFEFDFLPDGTIYLHKEVFEQLKPGLSAFKLEPEKGGESIVPLMEVAKREVPADAKGCTPIALKATAGLRLVGAEASDAILSGVRNVIRSYDFDPISSRSNNVAVLMDGRDEGPYAWMTVNFLLGNLGVKGDGATAAILDLGGGSTQIVFQPDRPAEILAAAPSDFVYETTLLGSHHKLYQNSYLGMGLKEATRRVAKAWNDANEKSAEKNHRKSVPNTSILVNNFPCLPAGYEMPYTDNKVKGPFVTNDADGGESQGFEVCSALIVKTLMDRSVACPHEPCSFNGIYQPTLQKSFSGPIYAFSYFFDRLEPFLPVEGIIRVGTIRDIGRAICNNNNNNNNHDASPLFHLYSLGGADKGNQIPFVRKIHNIGTICLDFSFMYSLLGTGYGLADSQHLHIKKRIKGVETAWALGAMIQMMK